MGQRKDYLENDSEWHASLTRAERLNRWWCSASFGLALSGKASRGLAASERAVAVAEAARDLVRHQAIYALLKEGLSVRDIAGQLQLSKSQVGRIVKILMKDGQLEDLTILPPQGLDDEVLTLVLGAWGMSDLTSAIQDYPRGTIETMESKRTNFGGTNGHQ